MALRKNNKGFSLVEMMVAVAILSIVMIAIGGIMAAMSQSFGQSQREVQLQNSVQSTYSIVSEIIKEAQSSNDTIASVEYDSATNRAYIIVEDTTTPANSIFYIIELLESRSNMYLYTGTLYSDPATKTMVDYKAASSTLVCQAQNLLATNVSEFEINTDKLASGGYVVLGLECAYGTREASITQNVYLRNSNMSAEWVNTITSAPTDDLDGYVLESITGSTCSKGTWNVGSTPQKSDFVLTGRYVNESDPTDTKQATVPDSAYTSDQLGVQLTTVGSKEIIFNVTGTSITHSHTITVIQGSVSISCTEEGVDPAGMSDINHHGVINVYYSSDQDATSTSYNVSTSEKVLSKAAGNYCPSGHLISGSNINTVCGNSSCWSCNQTWAGVTNGKCNACGQTATNLIYYCDSGCWKNYTSAEVEELTEDQYTTNTSTFSIAKTGTGRVAITNTSTTTDYTDVKVRLYFDKAKTGFKKYPGSSEFLVVDSENTNGNQAVTYTLTGSKADNYSGYIEINIPYMPKGNDTDGYTTYTFYYAWASADNTMTSDDVATMAVFSTDAD